MVVRAAAGSVRDALSVLDQLIAGAGPDGVTHAYAASLLGYTDAALLDDVSEALAAGDAAAVFELVDRVVDSGIDPRRFVADLLERLRDLVIVQAVPDAAAKGVLHAPADQVERLVGQAARFGPAELTRAADLVATGLTEMRGATSPRLQLELICARILLPGADTQGERGLAARVDRLERRIAIPPAAPAAAAPTAARARPAAPPAEPAASAAPTQQPPAPLAPAGALDVTAVRGMWPDVLERVKAKRRVTWMLLFDKAQVLGVDAGTLTLGFPEPGPVKGFASGGHDEVLRQALIDVLGVDWRVDAVHQPGGGTARASRSAGSASSEASVSAAPSVSDAPTASPAEDPADDSDPDDGLAGAELVARELGGRVIGEVGS
jgi:DNA polymerase-3 subunit gamma/tau